MEQEKILSTLGEKLGKTSFSPQTLETYVKNNLPAEGAEPDDAYWTTHVGFLQSLGGQYNHDVAAAVEAAKKNFTPTPQSTPQPAPQPSGSDDEISKRLAALEQMLADEKKKNSVGAIRQTVAGKGEELKVTNKPLWNDAVSMVEMKDGMTDGDLLDAAKKVYEAKLKSYLGEGATPYAGLSGGAESQTGNKEAEAKREAFKQGMIARGKLPKETKE